MHQLTVSILIYRHILSFFFFFNPITGLDRPWGFQEVEAPRFQDSGHMKVIKLSALRIGRLYPAANISSTHFYYRRSQPYGHNAAGRIMSMKNSNDTIGNRTRDLPACSAVPQPTAPPRAPYTLSLLYLIITQLIMRLECDRQYRKLTKTKNHWQRN